MPSGYLSEVWLALKRRLSFERLVEFTVECNPDSVTEAFLEECKAIGVTRFSVGLQSANDPVLKKIERIHDVEKFVSAVRLIKRLTRCDIGSDLIIGLPGEGTNDVKRGVDIIESLGVEHISLYALSVEDGTPLQKSGYSPDEDAQADTYAELSAYLKAKGYDRYEVSNFAKNGKISRHNYKYWTGADYYGFGVAAHSLIDGVRYANTNELSEYLKGDALREKTVLTVKDKTEELIMLGLRTFEGFSLDEYRDLTGKELLREKSKEIKRLLSLGAIEISDGALRATDGGIYLLNSIITELI